MKTITIERETGAPGKWADAATVYVTGNPPELKTGRCPAITEGMRFTLNGKCYVIKAVEHRSSETIIKTGEKSAEHPRS